MAESSSSPENGIEIELQMKNKHSWKKNQSNENFERLTSDQFVARKSRKSSECFEPPLLLDADDFYEQLFNQGFLVLKMLPQETLI